MRKFVHAALILLLLLIFSHVSFVQAGFHQRGTIRGTVYQDLDGDGACGSGDTTIAGYGLRFRSGANDVFLTTGHNGTYGLVAAGQGEWTVTAVPPNSSSRVTSQNPLKVLISSSTTLVRTNVNFCATGGTGTAITTQASAATINTPSSVPILESLSRVPSRDLNVNYAVSEAILTTELPTPDYEELEEAEEDTGGEDAPVANLPAWLDYVNQFRSIGNLPLLTENPTFTQGSVNHGRFLVLADKCCAHSENINNPLYTPEGYSAGKNGNIFSSPWSGSTMEEAINFWISAPFHLLGIIDPALTEAGYGEFVRETGVIHMAAVLDVRAEEIGNIPVPDDRFPIYFPANGSETFIVRRTLYEWPNPLTTPACAGFSIPTGPPLVIMVGDGGKRPVVDSHTVFENGRPVASCAFTEQSYQNSDPFAQATGRAILDSRDAVVITPRHPLVGGATYRVEAVVNGEFYSWEFSVRN